MTSLICVTIKYAYICILVSCHMYSVDIKVFELLFLCATGYYTVNMLFL